MLKIGKQTVVYVCAMSMLGQIALANTQRPGLTNARPGLSCEVVAKSADPLVEISKDPKLEAQAKAVMKLLAADPLASELSDAEKMELAATMLENDSAAKAVRSLLNDKSDRSRAIAKTKLKLIKSLGALDPFSSQIQSLALTNPEMAEEINYATFVLKVDSRNVSEAAKPTMIEFLEHVLEYIENSAKKSEVLGIARVRLSTEKGIDIPVDRIPDVLGSNESVNVLFKTANDAQPIMIGSNLDGVPLMVRLSTNKVEEIEREANDAVNTMLDIIRNPNLNYEAEVAEKALKGVTNNKNESIDFIKGNALLDSKSTEAVASGEVTENTAANINELLTVLKAHGAKVQRNGAKGLWDKFRGSIPGANRVFGDPSIEETTLREKIEMLRGVLADGANQLAQNNQTLTDLRHKATLRLEELQVEMAKLKSMSIKLAWEVEQLKSTGQEELSKLVQINLVLKVEKELNDAIAVHSFLAASIMVIDQNMSNNYQTITQVKAIENTAIPIIGLKEALGSSLHKSKQVIQNSDRIREFASSQLEQLAAISSEITELNAKASSSSLINMEQLDKFLTQVAADREKATATRLAAVERMKVQNEKMIQMHNRNQKIFEEAQAGAQLHK